MSEIDVYIKNNEKIGKKGWKAKQEMERASTHENGDRKFERYCEHMENCRLINLCFKVVNVPQY